jgi:nicotinate-nucleotide pyrophosphorylase (carboxylating)
MPRPMDEPLPPIPRRFLDVAAHLSLIQDALEEDDADRDPTAAALIPEGAMGVSELVSHEDGIIAGLDLLAPPFELLYTPSKGQPDVEVVTDFDDGDPVSSGAVIATVRAPSRVLISGERTALNLLRHLSGIATLTAEFVARVQGTSARIYDTRKTLPTYRDLQKYAVLCGGGENHRHSLADARMIKENHLRAGYGRTGPEVIAQAVARAKEGKPPDEELYVEVETMEELAAVLPLRPDVVMLDGFDLGALRRAVLRVRASPPPHPAIEATGGITLENVEAVAAAGVDRISVGALTHSAPALDLSMRFRPTP